MSDFPPSATNDSEALKAAQNVIQLGNWLDHEVRAMASFVIQHYRTASESGQTNAAPGEKVNAAQSSAPGVVPPVAAPSEFGANSEPWPSWAYKDAAPQAANRGHTTAGESSDSGPAVAAPFADTLDVMSGRVPSAARFAPSPMTASDFRLMSESEKYGAYATAMRSAAEWLEIYQHEQDRRESSAPSSEAVATPDVTDEQLAALRAKYPQDHVATETVLDVLESSAAPAEAAKVCPRCGDAAKCSAPGCPLAAPAEGVALPFTVSSALACARDYLMWLVEIEGVKKGAVSIVRESVERALAEYPATTPETPGSWEERCAVLYQVIGALASAVGIFETSDDVSNALDVAVGRGDVENLLPWPKDVKMLQALEKLCAAPAEGVASAEPTPEMVWAGEEAMNSFPMGHEDVRAIWKAMLAKSPQSASAPAAPVTSDERALLREALAGLVGLAEQAGMNTHGFVIHAKRFLIQQGVLPDSPSAESASRFSPAQAKAIIACRNAMVEERDWSEAWHQLYTLQTLQPDYDPYKPWLALEAIIAADRGNNDGG